MNPVFVLSTPWSLCDGTEDRAVSRQLLGATPLHVRIEGPLLVAAPADPTISASGRHRGMEPQGLSFAWGDGREYRIDLVSVGTRPDEQRIEIRADGAVRGTVELDGHLPRPGWAGAQQGGPPTEARADALDRFILGTIERIRMANRDNPTAQPTAWARLDVAWAEDHEDATEPPRDLIVRQAEEMRTLIADLAAHPRRILERLRQLLPIDRVQQLDTACVRWLSRQPGRNVHERAGPRQRILAVARRETVDTLENRVFRAFVDLSSEVARSYCRRYAALRVSQRWRRVDRYGAECKRLGHDLRELGIGRPEPPFAPNYALLHEARYRKVWVAWRALRRRLDEQDEGWRWQHRLWADFCRLALHISLRRMAPSGIVAESPLRIAAEQMRGRWSRIDAQTGVFLLDRNGRRYVLSPIGDLSLSHPKVARWTHPLGATSMLHVQALDNNLEAVILIWPLHAAGAQRPSLQVCLRSADRALEGWLNSVALNTGERPRAGGLILISEVENADHEQPDSHGCIRGFTFSPVAPLATTMRRFDTALMSLIERLTA